MGAPPWLVAHPLKSARVTRSSSAKARRQFWAIHRTPAAPRVPSPKPRGHVIPLESFQHPLAVYDQLLERRA